MPRPNSPADEVPRPAPGLKEGAAETTPAPGVDPARPATPGGRRRRRLVVGCMTVGLVVAGLILAHHPLLVGYASLFRVDDPAPSDVLVLLIGGIDHRPAKALELYRQGLAPVILMGSSTTLPVLAVNESVQTQKFLVAEGVPPEAVQLLPGGPVTSTFDEAVRVRDYVRSHPVRRILLVTTDFHSARARWIFRKVLAGEGVEVRVAACSRPSYNESNWYRDEAGLLDYLEETIKTLRYRLKY